MLTEKAAWEAIAEAYENWEQDKWKPERAYLAEDGLCHAVNRLYVYYKKIGSLTSALMTTRIFDYKRKNRIISGYIFPVSDKQSRAKLAREFAKECS